MSLFSGIEKSIERGFQRWTERLFGAADANELMLTHRAILEEIESKIETLARGRRVFPFAHLTVTLVSADANRRHPGRKMPARTKQTRRRSSSGKIRPSSAMSHHLPGCRKAFAQASRKSRTVTMFRTMNKRRTSN